jgi:dihydrofolate synthase/folylpolyglutamate synthase
VIDRLLALQAVGMKLGLEGISRLCEALDHPERSFIALHIAGTNGKGSVTAMVHEALVSAGLRAARYTSPHLSDLSERFVIGREPVSHDAMRDAAAHILGYAESLVDHGELPGPPTFFEATTAMAFELFKQAQVDVAVVEVGLGGRFDATNVLDAPLGAITSLGRDHEEYLGNSIEAIAREKAGIIKRGMTVVTGPLPQAAANVVAEIAATRGAAVLVAKDDTRVSVDLVDGRTRLTVDTPVARYGPLTLALRGEHQVANALVAIRLLEASRRSGLALTSNAIERGLTHAYWPARLELMTLEGGRLVLIDAAHNVDAAQALADYLRQWHTERPTLVLGAMDDKDLDGMLRALLPVTSSVVATTVDLPRALPAKAVAACVSKVDGARPIEQESRPEDALDRALAHGRTVCVAGSIYVAAAVRDAAKPRAILLDTLSSP